MLDEKIECSECHRVFFAKSTAGKRVVAPDYTKVYVGFGVAIVAIIGIFVLSGGNNEPPPKKKKVVIETPPFGRSDHPRAIALAKWATSIGTNNQLVLVSHTDVPAMATFLELESSDSGAVMTALQTLESTMFLRTMECTAMLDTDADMTAASGTALIYVTPKSGDDRFKRNTNGRYAVTFIAEGDTVKVGSFKMTREPVWMPGQRPVVSIYTPNKDIAAPEQKTITDSGGTRVVQESEPAAVPHWKNATPELRALADEVTADIIKSADNMSPATLFNRATMKIRTMEQKQAAVPRVLNAMFDRYGDVNKNNLELSQLNRALIGWTGYAVNYQVPDMDPAKDKVERESSIRQWFAFWWRYHQDLSKFFDERDNLEAAEDAGGGKK